MTPRQLGLAAAVLIGLYVALGSKTAFAAPLPYGLAPDIPPGGQPTPDAGGSGGGGGGNLASVVQDIGKALGVVKAGVSLYGTAAGWFSGGAAVAEAGATAGAGLVEFGSVEGAAYLAELAGSGAGTALLEAGAAGLSGTFAELSATQSAAYLAELAASGAGTAAEAGATAGAGIAVEGAAGGATMSGFAMAGLLAIPAILFAIGSTITGKIEEREAKQREEAYRRVSEWFTDPARLAEGLDLLVTGAEQNHELIAFSVILTSGVGADRDAREPNPAILPANWRDRIADHFYNTPATDVYYPWGELDLIFFLRRWAGYIRDFYADTATLPNADRLRTFRDAATWDAFAEGERRHAQFLADLAAAQRIYEGLSPWDAYTLYRSGAHLQADTGR